MATITPRLGRDGMHTGRAALHKPQFLDGADPDLSGLREP